MGKGISAAARGLLGLVLLVLAAGISTSSNAVLTPAAGNCSVPGESGADANLNAQQIAVARTIVDVGRNMNVSERGTAIALGTAMQESTLDPNAVNGRSIGLFQQQGELYATVRRTDPADTSRAFYEQLIARVPNYANASEVAFADAAQRVQASGAGASWYARWETWATKLAAHMYGGSAAAVSKDFRCALGSGSGPIKIHVRGTTVTLPSEAGIFGTLTFPNEKATTVAASALSYLGTPYAWGGGTASGPSKGIRDGGVADAHRDYEKTGFDCSGLMEYAFAQVGIALPGTSQPQQLFGTSLPWSQALPGDMVFWGRPATHVALYLGTINGVHYMVEAPQSGDVVKVSPVRTRAPGFDSLVVRAW